jgi:glycine/D-amino acid oxidase-like deaminating enzyme
LGGEIREDAGVAGFEETSEGVRLRLESGEEVVTNRALFTTGAWGASLFPSMGLRLPMTANKQQVVYVEGLGGDFATGTFPVFLDLDDNFYGFPLDAAGRFKSAIHEPGPLIDPYVPEPPDAEATDRVTSLLRRYIPRALQEGQVTLARVCMYAMTPDEDFIIDRFPGTHNVTLAAGFSGHGFKFAPLIGRLLAALALGEEPEFPLEPFSVSRFV